MSPIAHRRRVLAGPLALVALACAACTLAPRPAEPTKAPVVAESAPAAPKAAPARPETAPAAPEAGTPIAPKPARPKPAAPAKPPPAKQSAPREAAAPKPPSPPVAAVAPSQRAPLDVKSLEARLKETPAIGVMTKLSLKNQVDDLLEKFRDYYEGRLQASLADLRRPFDLLLMKVLSLLQDADPALARDVHDSRDALWAILTDPERFRKLSS